jgi:ABC-type phosphate transport system substrate-binding protein
VTRSRLRPALAAIAAGVVVMAVATPSPSASAAPQQQQLVTVQGAGAWSVSAELTAWQNELATAADWVNLDYVKHGSALGRQDLVAGNVDFAISGTSFTTEELAGVKGGASAFIDAPIQVASLATFVEPPQGGFQSVTVRCDPDDPATWPPDVTDGSVECIVKAPYTGPIRIPNRDLGAMIVHYVFGAFPPLNAWNHPDVLAAFGVDAIDTGRITAAPGFAGRSDPDEVNFYLQTFVKTAAPDIWAANAAANPTVPWEPITERMGQVVGVSRDGAEQQLAQLVQGGCGVFGLCAPDVAGGIAPAPPSMLAQFHVAFPEQPVELAQMQNANGDWVGPTVGAINKAVDAGRDTPLYALTHDVPGAYPLVWVDRLYAPAHGLSVDKTEGLATLIRYLATTGQEKATAAGDGRLPAVLVQEALDAANKLVLSNCVGAGRRVVVSSDPGRAAPPTAKAMRAIGQMLHCEAVAPPTTVSTVAATTTTVQATAVPGTAPPVAGTFDNGASSGSSALGDASAVPDAPATPGSDGSSPAGGKGRSPTASVGAEANTLLTASKLPLGRPDGASGTDRLATFLLGAVLYLLVRRPVIRAARRIAAST